MRESDKDNSTEAYDEHKKTGRSGQYRQRIFEVISKTVNALTDRDLMQALDVSDPNLIRPEVTRLKDDGILISAGKTVCPVTGHKVRLSRWSGRPLTERGRKPVVNDKRLKTCEFIEASSLVPSAWRSWFWGWISDSAPFSWGDNNRTLVTASRFKTWCDNCLSTAAEVNDEDMEVEQKDIDNFLEVLSGLGETYIDLEN